MMIKPKIAVLLPGHANDQGWNASAARAVEHLAQQGLPIIYQEGIEPSSIRDTLDKYSREGYELIVGHGCEFCEPVLDVAGLHPNTDYFVMDQPFGSPSIPTNVCFLHQKQMEGAFLCGRLAAWLSQSGTVGFLGGTAVPTQKANGNAFRLGVESLKPEWTTLETYAGTFEDRELGRKLALQLIESGADIIMQTADTTGLGVLDICKGKSVMAIGYILDQQALAPQHIATSLIVDVTRILQTKAKQALESNFASGIWEVGLAEGLVGLGPLASFVGEDIRNDLQSVYAQLVSGQIQLHP